MTVVLVLACLLLVGAGLGAALGFRFLVVETGSMRPALQPGDLVLSRTTSPLSVHRGEIVTFRDVLRHNELVTHRVVKMVLDGPVVHFTTKGDANNVPEMWSVPRHATIGREVAVIPAVGRVLSYFTTTLARLLFTALIAFWIAVIGLRWIWRGGREPSATATAG